MRYTNQPPAFGGAKMRLHVTPWVKILLISNAVVYLVTLAVGRGPIFDLFAFSPDRILQQPWGMLTYMFVHAGFWHLLMNMLFIFFFGPPLEERWGSEMFLKFYLVCGLGGVLLSFLFAEATIVGASAACYGIMLAFAMAWPNQPVYVWGVWPVKVKWLVTFMVAISFASAIGPTRDGVAHLAHLGGVIVGFLFVKSGWLPAGAWEQPRRTRAGKRPGSTRGPAKRGGSWTAKRRGPGWTEKRRGTSASSTPIGDAFERRKVRKRMSEERAELDRVDAVLDKISAQGIDSLTAEARDLLDRVSKQTKAN